jgi:hypothetical protein
MMEKVYPPPVVCYPPDEEPRAEARIYDVEKLLKAIKRASITMEEAINRIMKNEKSCWTCKKRNYGDKCKTCFKFDHWEGIDK